MSRPAKVILKLDALRHNFKQIKKLAPHSFVLAMVKSNGYGHGIERVALALPEADAFGVACMEEGLLLRAAGVRNPIVLIEGLFSEDELSQAVAENFTLVVHHEAQVRMLELHSPSAPLSVWLKIDTGMHRLGIAFNEVKEVYQRLFACPAVKKPLGLMSHFAMAEDADHVHTEQQILQFDKATAGLTGFHSLCNSAGIIAWPSARREWVRPGLMLYGASPFVGQQGADYELQPVMSLQSKLIAIHRLVKDDCVGYGRTWKCPEDMLIGVAAVGYGDGYPQYTKTGTSILVNGQRCPLVGRVSMDMLTVDLRSQPDAKVGDPIVLWGETLPVEEVAQGSHTSAYELLTRITQRVKVIVT
ncbi:MAG: alr [Gammaproteobacteria bacterium]|jgi:alanine racemase|nr:alr [Gammaproteobacteria bacterium]